MAALNKAFTQALLTIKNNGKGRLMNTDEDWFEVSYDTKREMLSDAQLLNHFGYKTQLNRNMYNMTVSLGM